MATKENKKKACPSCDGGMVHESRTDFVEYKGHRKEFKSTGWWCTECDEAIFDGPELLKAERAFVELRAKVDEVMLPEEVAEVREKLKLSQREAGKVLGGGPRAFQKYESGSVPVSVPMNNLLKLLGNDPKRIRELSPSTPSKIVAGRRMRAEQDPFFAEPRKGVLFAAKRMAKKMPAKRRASR